MKNKVFTYIFSCLLLVTLAPCFAQKSTSTSKRIDDNGTTLELYLEIISSDKNLNYKRDFYVQGMSKMQKDSLVQHVLDSLGFNSDLSKAANKTTDSDIKSIIEKLNREIEEAFNNNDMMKVAAFYADNAEISANNYSVKGRSNIDKYWMDLKDKGRGWKLDVVEIGGRGEFVYQLGKSDLSHVSGDGNKPAKSVTNFILIWRLQRDGTYKIFRDYLTNTQFKVQ